MDPILLPMHCPLCGRAMTVVYAKPVDGVAARPYNWKCPYEGCAYDGTSVLHGRLVDVRAGHGPFRELP